MSEARIEYSADKAEAYRQLAEEIASVVAGETSRTARYATTVSLLTSAFGDRFFWCGFYEVDPRKERELVVGPYQGTLGCLRIPFAKGVCGACATQRETIVVPDVHAFPGHIACDSRSNSEIVVPVFDQAGALVAVLDVDSTAFAAFDDVDARGLEAVCRAMMAD
ncbi:MAG: GAF domain-containing protein [Alphaproteobacteria bacterium]|jgi:L-methionine (R)-S-oxide reductase|nr:MAG: GAF domain-containing protein [Alphaproteobacteria bacterium]